jgi:hypothetical protein
MTQVVVEVFEGAVVVRCQGEKHIIDRGDTGKLTVNTEDDPHAETPDNERWTEFEEAIVYRDGVRVEFPDGEVTFRNNQYTVTRVTHDNGSAYLTIKRNDRHWKHDWRHLQRIKNELLGTDVEAVELYPDEARLVDEANQFHLWALPPGVRYPLGFEEREVHDSQGADGAKQRPLSVEGEVGA